MAWPPPAPVVEVEWEDAQSHGSWRDPEEWRDHLAKQRCPCTSVGYLFLRDDDRVVLMQSVSQSGNYADAIQIPASCVLSVRVIAKARRRSPV